VLRCAAKRFLRTRSQRAAPLLEGDGFEPLLPRRARTADSALGVTPPDPGGKWRHPGPRPTTRSVRRGRQLLGRQTAPLRCRRRTGSASRIGNGCGRRSPRSSRKELGAANSRPPSPGGGRPARQGCAALQASGDNRQRPPRARRVGAACQPSRTLPLLTARPGSRNRLIPPPRQASALLLGSQSALRQPGPIVRHQGVCWLPVVWR
jgi:hypothetical protein